MLRPAFADRGAVLEHKVVAALATGEARYGERLLALLPLIEERIMWVGGAVAQALPAIADEAFSAAVLAADRTLNAPR